MVTGVQAFSWTLPYLEYSAHAGRMPAGRGGQQSALGSAAAKVQASRRGRTPNTFIFIEEWASCDGCTPIFTRAPGDTAVPMAIVIAVLGVAARGTLAARGDARGARLAL